MGLFGTLGGYVTQAGDEVKLAAEITAFSGLGIPIDWTKWYQNERKSLGFGPPSSTTIFGELIFIPMLLGMFILFIKWAVVGIFSFYSNGVTGKIQNPKQKLFFILTFSALLVYIAYLIYKFFIYTAPTNDATTAASALSGAGTTAGFENPSTVLENTDVQYKLVNIQPLAIKQSGFLGPTENNGTFNPEVTIMNAIRLGARFFTLQIDYLESPKDPKLFDGVNIPTLLYRNLAGKLISANGASINDVAKQIATYSFSPDIRNQTYPIIVYLHFVRTPDPIRKPNDYLNFMMKVSEALVPIQSFILKDTSHMNFRRQQNEISLLELDLTSIDKTIIVLSNADTTLFRNTKNLGITVGPMSDLDSFINMRVYLESSADSNLFGITQVISERTPYAIIVPFARLKAMSQKDRDSFAMKNKKRFVIAMPGPLESPTPVDIKQVLTDTGVNVIPLNLIGTDPKQITTLISSWGSDPFYKVKPMMLQSFKVGVSASTTR